MSNALEKSKAIRRTNLLEVKREVMTEVNKIMAEVGEPVSLKANWSSNLDLMRGLVKQGWIWSLTMYFSSIRKRIGVMEMGRY